MTTGIDDLELGSVGADPGDRTSTRSHVDLPSTGGLGAVKSIFGKANKKRVYFTGLVGLLVIGSFVYSYKTIDEPAQGGTSEINGASARTRANTTPTQAQRDESKRYNEEVLPSVQKEDPTAHPVVVTEDTGEFSRTREFSRPDKISEVGDTNSRGRGSSSATNNEGAEQKKPLSQSQVDLISKLIIAEGQATPQRQVVTWNYAPKKSSADSASSKANGATFGYDGEATGKLAGEMPTQCKNPLIRAGHQYVARSTMALNSDVGGPVIVELVNGPLRKHRLTGSFERKDEWMRMEFKSLVGINDPKQIKAIGLDMETVLNAVGGDVDYHTFYRYGWWGLGTILSAIGKAAEKNSDTQTIYVGDNIVTDTASDTSREIKMALGELGQSVGDVMKERINRPLTVSLKVNDLVGIVFMDDVCGDK